ncbi:amidohydrolase family protein [Actinomadura parmotrematis]|uniref:Amidohydrolase family protein n=1 Tax=Actinomadura parmotrematis TaxID=2864039 RepID=A0ABS7FYD3_9ACTN|nr:amidohydrolase family protein [Actinomadura parmotrematis]MBW8485326.1 amidohydrolase family protein [Actinomadura parmotrematis]
MIIDAHGHVHDPVDAHLALLDEAGADRAVLFPTRVHPERARDLAALGREMAALGAALGGRAGGAGAHRAAWRELDAAVAAHPGRFLPFVSVPLDVPAGDVAVLVEREVVGRGAYGIGELTPPPGRADVLGPVLAAAADHGGLPVVVHGAAPTTADDLRTLAALARRHPSVPLVVSQLGGLHWMEAVGLVRDVPSMYLELSTAPVVFAVRLAIEELPERALSGSDAPYGDPVLARAAVERVTAPGEVRDRVLGGTLAALLGIG